MKNIHLPSDSRRLPTSPLTYSCLSNDKLMAESVRMYCVMVAVLTLSHPLPGVKHQPGLGILQLPLQSLVLGPELPDLLLPLLQHPEPCVEVLQSLEPQETQTDRERERDTQMPIANDSQTRGRLGWATLCVSVKQRCRTTHVNKAWTYTRWRIPTHSHTL